MSKMSKTIAALGVAAGLGVAAMPLSSYAAIPEGAYTTATQAQVEVVVEGAITISSNATTPVSLGNIMPGKMSAASQDVEVTVSSNAATEYDLYIHATNDGVMTGKVTGATIDNVAPAENASGWGYAYSEEAFATDPTTFTALPTEATKVNGDTALATSAEGEAKPSNISHFKFAASASKNQTADTYTGTVIFTAVVE